MRRSLKQVSSSHRGWCAWIEMQIREAFLALLSSPHTPTRRTPSVHQRWRRFSAHVGRGGEGKASEAGCSLGDYSPVCRRASSSSAGDQQNNFIDYFTAQQLTIKKARGRRAQFSPPWCVMISTMEMHPAMDWSLESVLFLEVLNVSEDQQSFPFLLQMM